MNSRHDNARLRASRRRAFTILELLVAVSVMTLVIYVLYALFNQTQMALRKNASQVDVNEGGRAAMEMIVRELSQMEVSGYPAITDLQTKLTYSGSKSFFSRVTPGNTALLLAYQSDALPPVEDAWAKEQGLPDEHPAGLHLYQPRRFRVSCHQLPGDRCGQWRRHARPVPHQRHAASHRACQALLNKTEIFNRFYFEPVANTSRRSV